MPRPLKQALLGASTITLSKDIDKYAFRSGSNFYETVFRWPFYDHIGSFVFQSLAKTLPFLVKIKNFV